MMVSGGCFRASSVRLFKFEQSSRSVIKHFQNYLEKSVHQDAQRAYDLGHKEVLRQCAEKIITARDGVNQVLKYTTLPKKEIYALDGAQMASEMEVVPENFIMSVEHQSSRKIKIADDVFEKYLGDLSATPSKLQAR